MQITVNGNRREAPDGLCLLDLLATLDLKPQATVVERNGTVVKRPDYPEIVLAEGDVLELIRFVGGG